MPAFITTRRLLLLIALGSLAALVFGLYLQHGLGLEPCPMCIVQRYTLLLLGLLAGLGSLSKRRLVQSGACLLVALLAGLGAFVAARQSWLQWFPPEVVSCGRDLYGMIETFPLQRLIPMIFKGGGDCSKVDWTFLGGSIANWSFLNFCLITVLALFALRVMHKMPNSNPCRPRGAPRKTATEEETQP